MRTESAEEVERFDGVERVVHWSVVGLSGVLVVTAGIMYIPSLAATAGRALIRDLHVGAGFLLPVPLLVALAGRWGRRLRDDIAELNRWDADDRRRLRSLGRATAACPGKFNVGQKLNAAFVMGAMLVMLGTGALLHWHRPIPLSWRTGATFVHDWLALGLVVVIAGHVVMAVTHPESLRGMVIGRVRRRWAERHHPRWALLSETGTGGFRSPGARTAVPLLAAAGGAVLAAATTLLPILSAGDRTDGPGAVARRFQSALERNDLEEAYSFLSPAARSQGMTPEAFFRKRIRQQDDRYLEPGQIDPFARAITVDRLDRVEGSARVAVRISMSDGRTIRRQVDLSRAGGRWAVDRVFLLAVEKPCHPAGAARSKGCWHAR